MYRIPIDRVPHVLNSAQLQTFCWQYLTTDVIVEIKSQYFRINMAATCKNPPSDGSMLIIPPRLTTLESVRLIYRSSAIIIRTGSRKSQNMYFLFKERGLPRSIHRKIELAHLSWFSTYRYIYIHPLKASNLDISIHPSHTILKTAQTQ